MLAETVKKSIENKINLPEHNQSNSFIADAVIFHVSEYLFYFVILYKNTESMVSI